MKRKDVAGDNLVLTFVSPDQRIWRHGTIHFSRPLPQHFPYYSRGRGHSRHLGCRKVVCHMTGPILQRILIFSVLQYAHLECPQSTQESTKMLIPALEHPHCHELGTDVNITTPSLINLHNAIYMRTLGAWTGAMQESVYATWKIGGRLRKACPLRYRLENRGQVSVSVG